MYLIQKEIQPLVAEVCQRRNDVVLVLIIVIIINSIYLTLVLVFTPVQLLHSHWHSCPEFDKAGLNDVCVNVPLILSDHP